MQKARQPITPEAARLRLATLCAHSEQCSHDLRAKLAKWGLSAADADEVLNFLTDNNFCDDRRFASAFTYQKSTLEGWGRIKIRMQLKMKGISSDIIEDALEEIDPEAYSDALLQAARLKARSLDLAKREDLAKLYRHLMTKGYTSAETSAIVKKIRET